MRPWRKNGDRVLVVGIFQSPPTGRAVLKNLYRAGFRRVAAIHAAGGRPRVEKYGIPMIGGAAAASAFGLAMGAFIFWQRGILADYQPGMLTLLLAAFALASALSGWILLRLLQQHVDEKRLAQFAGTLEDEGLVRDRAILRDLGGHPRQGPGGRVVAIEGELGVACG